MSTFTERLYADYRARFGDRKAHTVVSSAKRPDSQEGYPTGQAQTPARQRRAMEAGAALQGGQVRGATATSANLPPARLEELTPAPSSLVLK